MTFLPAHGTDVGVGVAAVHKKTILEDADTQASAFSRVADVSNTQSATTTRETSRTEVAFFV